MMHEGGLFRRKIFQHAGEPWEGNNFPLKADLIHMARQWSELVSDANGMDRPLPACPLSFDAREAEETLQGIIKQEEADHQMGILREVIGISADGWVSHEQFQDAVLQASQMKTDAAGFAENDFEREMTLKHWPFDDHDENEQVLHPGTNKSRRLTGHHPHAVPQAHIVK